MYNLKLFITVAACFLVGCSYADKYSDFIDKYKTGTSKCTEEFTEALKETLFNLELIDQEDTISSLNNCFGFDEEIVDCSPLYIFRLEKLKRLKDEKGYVLKDNKLADNLKENYKKYIESQKKPAVCNSNERKDESSFEWGD